MKSEEVKQKALSLYLNSLSIEKIAEQCGVGEKSIRDWCKKYKWEEQREKAIKISVEKAPEKYALIIDEQVTLTNLADKALLEKFQNQEEVKKEIIQLRTYWKELCSKEKPTKEEFMSYVESMRSLYSQLINDITLTTIMKHGLEVVRPKTQTQFNFMKQNNVNIITPEEAERLMRVLNGTQTSNPI